MSVENQGKIFEKWIQGKIDDLGRSVAIYKVDPPVRVLGNPARPRVIFLANPFLDFTGAWKGRAVNIEAKSRQPLPGRSIDKHWLKLRDKAGLTDRQIEAFWAYERAGSVTMLLWRLGEQVRLFTGGDVCKIDSSGINRLYWSAGIDLVRDCPFRTWEQHVWGREFAS
jgi:hypothetical protein